MKNIKIQESSIDLKNGQKGTIAVFFYTGDGEEQDPVEALDSAVSAYVGNEQYMELIDSNMDNPRVRVVMARINEMNQKEFDPSKHRLKV